MRLRESQRAPAPSEVEFIHSESRAVYQSLGGPLPPELEMVGRQAELQLPLVQRLSAQELEKELETTRLSIRRRLLVRQQEEIHALGRDGVDTMSGRLSDLSRAIHEIDQQLVPQRESAGSR